MKPEDVRPGMQLYVPTKLYIDRGEDDVQGGLATVERVEDNECKYEVNRWFVKMRGLPNLSNLTMLLEDQEKLAVQYAGKIAKHDPDYRSF